MLLEYGKGHYMTCTYVMRMKKIVIVKVTYR